MKKVLSYILISLIISANLLAPISVGWGRKGIEVQKNEARAEGSIIPLSVNSSSPVLRKTYVKIGGIFSSPEKIDVKDLSVEYFISNNQNEVTNLTVISGSQTGSAFQIYPKNENGITTYDYWFGTSIEQYANEKGSFDFEDGKTYYVYVRAIQSKDGKPAQVGQSTIKQFVGGVPSETGDYYITDDGKAAFIAAKEEAIVNGSTEEEAIILAQKNVGNEKDNLYSNNNHNKLPACGMGAFNFVGGSQASLMGCVVQGFYYILFVPTSYLFALAGTMFDYTFAYSVQDSSYKSAFVVQGWGLIRDFCNMFFIFIMLYVAIGTILSLHSMKTKETIVNIVIIGLFINFSLFATQLIIDASNITARVFYNSNAITITEKDANGVTNATPGLKVGEGGVIPLSAALVNKVNPQNLIFSADKINSIQNNTGSNIAEENKSKNLGIGQFILIIIMASAVNIVGLTVFITVAFLFIARVIGLWLAMILSPLAFFTYILPEMAGTKMIGWKNWWTDTLKMAFLAPVFIFFIYLILKFLQADLISDIASKSLSGDGLGYFVAILVPFAFIMILMIKAKKIAVDMSGEFGEMAVKAGSAVGGLALGAATGGAAFAMRGTLGALGDKVANNDWLKTHGGRLGNLARDAGKWTASKSFDVRSTALGGDAMKGMGVDAGKAKEGGYAKHKTEITEKRRERAESKKLGNMSEPVQTLHKTEERLSNLKNESINDTNRVDGMLAAKRLIASDASQKLTAGNNKLARVDKETTAKLAEIDADTTMSTDEKATAKSVIEKDLKDVQNEVQAAQKYFDDNAKIIADYTQERIDLNGSTGKYSHKTGNGKVNKKGYDDYKKNVVDKSDFVLAKAKADAQVDMAAAITDEGKAKVQAILDKAQKDYDETQKVFEEMQKATEGGTKNFEEDDAKVESLDNLSLRMIPELHHHVEKENADRVNKYAENIRGRWFNKEANDVAAHEAIMRSEVKKH